MNIAAATPPAMNDPELYPPMNDRDRAEWAAARSLPDLCVLTARWMVGDIGAHPSYPALDEESHPQRQLLADVNRRGLLTIDSQPGQEVTTAWDGRPWVQRAALAGFCYEPVWRELTAHLQGRGLYVRGYQLGRARAFRALPVTLHAGWTNTWFGGRYSLDDLAEAFPGIGADAFADLARCWQVTIVDPAWGRDDLLWPALDGFTGRDRP